MKLVERFKSWATSWWYVPTIEARQAQMLREVQQHALISRLGRRAVRLRFGCDVNEAANSLKAVAEAFARFGWKIK